MKRTYYGVLTRAIEMFDVGLEVKLVNRVFDLIVYPRRWFFVRVYGENLFNHLQRLSIPFIAIKDNSGIWFLDLGGEFSRFTAKINRVKLSFHMGVINDVSFVYNYAIFGEPDITNVGDRLVNSVSINRIKFACEKLSYDLVVKLEAIELYFNDPIVSFYIFPKDLVLKGLYLNHYVEPGNPVLTLRFIARVSELMREVYQKLGVNLGFRANKPLRTKKELLDIFEKRLLQGLFEKGVGDLYVPALDIDDIGARVLKIERRLKELIRKVKGFQ